MKFHEIIKSAEWISVEAVLLDNYPDEEHCMEDYRQVFESLKGLTPVDSNMVITLTAHEDGEETFVEVDGRKIEDQETLQLSFMGYALEFMPWDEWLGMRIAEDTLKSFYKFEIAAYCLSEMTFISFNEDEIQEQRDRMENVKNEFLSLSEEEQKKRVIPIDEFLNSLKLKNNDYTQN